MLSCLNEFCEHIADFDRLATASSKSCIQSVFADKSSMCADGKIMADLREIEACKGGLNSSVGLCANMYRTYCFGIWRVGQCDCKGRKVVCHAGTGVFDVCFFQCPKTGEGFGFPLIGKGVQIIGFVPVEIAMNKHGRIRAEGFEVYADRGIR